MNAPGAFPRSPRTVIVGLLLLLSACTVRRQMPLEEARSIELPTAEHVIAAMARRREALRGLRALGRVAFSSPEENRRAKQVILAARPDRLRFELLSPIGPLFVFTTRDGSFAAYARGENTIYRGAASAQSLERHIGLNLPVSAAVDLLLGTPPVFAHGHSVVSEDGGAVQLWQDRDGAVRVTWLTPQLEPLRFEERDADGRVLLRMTFTDPVDAQGLRLATRLAVELPPAEQRIEFLLEEPEINPALADDLFTLFTPPGSKEVQLDPVIQ